MSHLILAQDMIVGDIVTHGNRTMLRVCTVRSKTVETEDDEITFIIATLQAEGHDRPSRHEFDPHHILTKHN